MSTRTWLYAMLTNNESASAALRSMIEDRVFAKKTMKSSPGYIWNVNHTVPIDDPMELFPVHMTEAGV